MNDVINDYISQKLKNHLSIALEKRIFTYDKFVGIFAIGSMNYGLFSQLKGSDVDSYIIITPNLKDLVMSVKPISQEIITDNNEKILVKDLRLFIQELKKQNPAIVQILFTKYYFLNKYYAKCFRQTLLNRADKLALYNKRATIESIYHQFNSLIKKELTNKRIAMCMWLYYFLERFINGEIYIDCLFLSNELREKIWNIKFGITQIEEAKKELQYCINNIGELYRKTKNIHSSRYLLGKQYFENAATELMILSLKTSTKFSYSFEKFYNNLDDNAQEAYQTLTNFIGTEGFISYNQLEEESDIPIRIFKKIIEQMKKENIIETKTAGEKGLYINFVNPYFIKEIEMR